MQNGKSLATRLGIKEAHEAFYKTQDIYGCANWICEESVNGFIAICNSCLLCNIAKQMGTPSPCQLHCLSPIEAMIKGVEPNSIFSVEKTLWDGDTYLVRVCTDA